MNKPTRNIEYSADREANLLIAEFNALRAEMIDNFQTARTVATFYLAAVGAIFFAAISGQVNPNVIILVPGLSAIFWWVHLDTRMIVAILGGYLDILSERARVLGSEEIFTWEQEIRLKDRPLSAINLGFIPWKFGAALDGVAYLIYLPPSFLSLYITYGKVGGFSLYEDPTTKQNIFFTFGGCAWWTSVFFVFVPFVRAILTEKAWWKAPESLRRKLPKGTT